LKQQQDAICEANLKDPNSLILHGNLPIKDNQPRGLNFSIQTKAKTKSGKVWVDEGYY